MTKGEIIDSVVELVQDNSGAMRNLTARWIDLVLYNISSRVSLPSLRRESLTTLSVSQRDYTLPTDNDKVTRVFVPAWGDPQGIIQKLDNDEFLQQILKDGTSLTGRPWAYTIFARTLKLHPPPDSVNAPASPSDDKKLHVYEFKDIKKLATGDEITELQVKHMPTIIAGVYRYGARFDSLGDLPDALGQYEQGIALIARDIGLDYERPYASIYRGL